MGWQAEKEQVGRALIRALYEHGMIRTWFRDNPRGWTLVSGLWSPLYIQLRPLASYPTLLRRVGSALGRLIHEDCPELTRILGVATAGIPIATAISLETDMPACFTRKLEGPRSLDEFDRFVKAYGEHSMVEGILEDGDRVGIIDDLVTRFDSKVVALKQLAHEVTLRGLTGVRCSDVIVLLDREQGAGEVARGYGVTLQCLIPFRSKGIGWLRDILADLEYEVLVEYLRDSSAYQDQRVQADLAELAKRRP